LISTSVLRVGSILNSVYNSARKHQVHMRRRFCLSNPSTVDQVIKFVAKVTTSNPSVGSPTGTVNFYDGGSTLIGSGTLSGGLASYSTGSLSVGVHSITSVYVGNTNFATSTSSIYYQTVNTVTATIAVVSNHNPLTVGQSVKFTATASGSVGTPTGTATFFADGTQIGTAQALVSGQASVTISSLSAAIHAITVQYSGDRTYPAGTGSLLGGQTVNTPGVVATTTVISNHNPSTNGQSVTFTATVSGSSGTPTGTVTFFADGAQIGAAQTLSSGQASISTSSLPIGSHTIAVRYSGNNTYGSNSGSLTGGQVVNPIPISTSTSVVSSLNPSLFGSSVTFTASVSTSGPGTPTGTIYFYDGTTLLRRVALGGVLTYTTSSMSMGSHAITAIYSGDSNFAGSTSSVLTQVVNPSSGPDVLFAALSVPSSPGHRAKPSDVVRVKRAVKATPTGRLFFMKERKGQLYLRSQRPN
jgi:Bacterial Ig-like domain (group 3)